MGHVMTLVGSLHHISLLDLFWMCDDIDLLFLDIVIVLLFVVLELCLSGVMLLGVLVSAY